MPERLKKIFTGIYDALPSLANGPSYPKYEGFAADAANMRGDWQALGDDMRKALKKEKTSHNRAVPKHG
jgi:hypothetical protein